MIDFLKVSHYSSFPEKMTGKIIYIKIEITDFPLQNTRKFWLKTTCILWNRKLLKKIRWRFYTPKMTGELKSKVITFQLKLSVDNFSTETTMTQIGFCVFISIFKNLNSNAYFVNRRYILDLQGARNCKNPIQCLYSQWTIVPVAIRK